MINALHVLSIGTPESNGIVRDALLSRAKSQLFSATSVWDLSAFLTLGRVDVAILHNVLSAAELRSCAVYIRHNLPSACILLIQAESEVLDDPMYDERIEPGSSKESLLTAIERLAAVARRHADTRGKEHAEPQAQ